MIEIGIFEVWHYHIMIVTPHVLLQGVQKQLMIIVIYDKIDPGVIAQAANKRIIDLEFVRA
jgi:hypothetical protein